VGNIVYCFVISSRDDKDIVYGGFGGKYQYFRHFLFGQKIQEELKMGLEMIKVTLKKAFNYRSSVIFNIIGSVFSILISMALWKYVYSYDVDKMNYMIIYVIISNIIGMFYSKAMIGEIGGKVFDGSFALELIRPVNFVYISYMRMLGDILANVIMRGLTVIAIFLPVIISRADLIRYEMLGLFVFTVMLGHFLFTVLFALLGYMAFICIEIWPFRRLMEDTIRFLSGSFIPLALFPEWLKEISMFLPFRFLYSLPIEILIGEISVMEIGNNIVIMGIWLVGLFGLFVLLFKRAVNSFVVQGG